MQLKKVYSSLKKLLEKKVLKYNFDLETYNTYKLKCVAKVVVIVNTIETFVKTMKICEENNIKPIILAQGSNVIFKNPKLNNVVIIFGDNFSNIYKLDDMIIAESGAKLCDIIKFAKENSLSGLEEAIGIPASIGGAVYMNASAFGYETAKVVNSVIVYSKGKIKLLKKDDLKFGYRYSNFQENDDIILRVELTCAPSNKEEINKKIIDTIKVRNQKQKIFYPNAGSVFRNVNNYFAGELIDKCGLKNYNIGNAYISNYHANFIENRGGATGEDIIALIEYVKSKVFEKFGVELELEQKIIGE